MENFQFVHEETLSVCTNCTNQNSENCRRSWQFLPLRPSCRSSSSSQLVVWQI